ISCTRPTLLFRVELKYILSDRAHQSAIRELTFNQRAQFTVEIAPAVFGACVAGFCTKYSLPKQLMATSKRHRTFSIRFISNNPRRMGVQDRTHFAVESTKQKKGSHSDY
ncbi:MAG: hypothetical protein M3R15_01520, partial [Acidobacteriota bacterium]|nr:hypothetical protein [Acidobacteriota bacterium]